MSIIKYDGVFVLLLSLGLHLQATASEVVLQVVFVWNADQLEQFLAVFYHSLLLELALLWLGVGLAMNLAFFGLSVELGLELADSGEVLGLFRAVFCYLFLEIESLVLQLMHAGFFLNYFLLEISQLLLGLSWKSIRGSAFTVDLGDFLQMRAKLSIVLDDSCYFFADLAQ